MSISLRAGSRIAALIAASISGGVGPSPSTDANLRRAIVDVSAAMRPAGGRLAGFPYPPRGGTGASVRDLRRLTQAVTRRLETAGTAEALSNAALLELLRGRNDRAVALLQEAGDKAPRSAVVLSDLGIAYMACASQGGARDTGALKESLAALDRALRADARLAEARFNQALVLERLSLSRGAAAAWARYLRLDSDSSWAAEANTHLEELNKPLPTVDSDRLGPLIEAAAVPKNETRLTALIHGAHEASRLYVEETVFARWARAEREGRPEQAARVLAVARAVGSRLAAVSGDWLIADGVAAIDRVGAFRPAELRAMAAGHELLGEAVARERADSYGDAARLLVRARDFFTQTNSPFGSYAALHLAICEFFAEDYRGARALIEDVLERTNPARAPTLYMRCLLMQGLLRAVAGDFGSALAPYRAAAEICERMEEPATAGYLRGLLAIAHRNLGDNSAAWDELGRALRTLPTFADSRRVYGLLEEAADAAAEEGRADVALHFLDEMVARSYRGLLPGVWAETLLRRARIELREGQRPRAEHDLNLARGLLARIGDAGLHQRVAIDMLVVEGQARLAADPRGAASLLGRALAYFRRSNHQLEATELYGQVAAAEERAGAPILAADSLAKGIAFFEAERARLEKDPRRHEFFERGQGLFDRMIALQATVLHNPEAALEYAERARARSLLDLYTDRAATSLSSFQPLDPAAIRRALPEGVTLIELAALPDCLVSWTVTRNSILVRIHEIPYPDLAELCGRWRLEIEAESGHGARSPAAERLRVLITAPLLPAIRGSRAVVFVPDRALSSLPFAALPGAAPGHLLLDEAAVSVEPSASLYVAALARARRAKMPPRNALVVVTDGFDRVQFPTLSALPGARGEATMIAALYPAAKLLTGPIATKQNFLAAAPGYEVIHLAGHTLFDAAYPGAPALLMAAPGGAARPVASLLQADELYALRLPAARLIVLAGCGSALGRNPTREGVMNLVRPLLATGVPNVVASLWAIDDEASSQFFARFHALVVAGTPPVQALRTVQLELAHGTSSFHRAPSHWAAFELIGGAGAL